MARYKHCDYQQTKMIPLRFADQIQAGTFEYTLNHLIDALTSPERALEQFKSIQYHRVEIGGRQHSGITTLATDLFSPYAKVN